MYKIKILKNNNWELYTTEKGTQHIIEDDEDKEKKMLHTIISGTYYGSSTRIGKLGEVINQSGYHDKKIRVLNDADIILGEFHLTTIHLKEQFDNNDYVDYDDSLLPVPIKIGWPINLYDEIRKVACIVRFRDLHRFPGQPTEISGLTIYKKI